MTVTLDLLTNAASATVTAGGLDAPASGTVETLTVTTASAFVGLPLVAGEIMRCMDAIDLGKTSGYEIVEITTGNNGTGQFWQCVRGAEGTTPHTHAANWNLVPVGTAGGLDGRYRPWNFSWSGADTDVVETRQRSGDINPRWARRADDRQFYGPGSAPVNFGTHLTGDIGAGSDYLIGLEAWDNTAWGRYFSFPRMHMTDPAGTDWLILNFPATFPLTGSPALSVSLDTGSITGFAASGTLTAYAKIYGASNTVPGSVTHTGWSAVLVPNTTGATAGTWTVRLTGPSGPYTLATFNWNTSAASMQTTLSDGTHGPAGTTVTGTAPGALTITVPLNVTVAFTFSLTGATPGTPSAAYSLTGCTSTGLTTSTDTSQRFSDWFTDSFGAPIAWGPANFGGYYLNDNYNFRYSGVFASAEYDIMTAFANVARNAGSAVYFGGDNFVSGTAQNTASIGRGNDGFGNGQLLFKVNGSGGPLTITMSIAGWYASTASSTLGTSTNPWGPVHTLGINGVESTNSRQGVATLVAGSKVVSNTSVTATSRIQLTAQDNNTTGALRVSARTVGTSFTITSSNGSDTGVVAFVIFEPS